MKRSAFEETNEERWQRLETTVTLLEKGQKTPDTKELPHLFRRVCGDLALAQHRMYGRKLCDRLNTLVIEAYQHLHRAMSRSGGAFLRLFTTDFPQAVRAEWRLAWICLAIFFVPFGGFITAAYFEPKWIYAVLSPEMREMMDGMYGSASANEFIREKFGSDFMMFGYYILNNVSISFFIFAGGVAFAIGGIWSLGYQGVILGAMFGYVHAEGNLKRLYTFCASHSSWELLGFVLSATAGIRIGLAFAVPGRLTRGAAFREAGEKVKPILYGSTCMLVAAAAIEGFWSASGATPAMKYTMGLIGWLFFAAYFFLVGRRAHAA